MIDPEVVGGAGMEALDAPASTNAAILSPTEESRSVADQALHPSLAPLLAVRIGVRAIDFYKAAFGAIEIFRTVSDDGAIVAQLKIDGTDFWLADESPDNQNFSPATLGGTTVRMVLVVEDPDAVFERALAAGARALYPVVDQPYGWRIGRLVDPYGHHWEIGRPIA